jgi:hypothetical protein
MKYFLLFAMNLFTTLILAQFDKDVKYVDGTSMRYKIKENDPNLFPNISAEIGGSLGRLTYSPLSFNLETGLRMKFKRYGAHVSYTQLLVKELMEDVIVASNSDNGLNNYYEFKAGIDLDIWSRINDRNGKINLKTSKVGNTKIYYRVEQDNIKRKKTLSFQTGYMTHTGAISNGMRRNQSYYLTDVNGFALVQNRPEIVDESLFSQREYVNFHTNLKAHLLYFGINYSFSEHIVAKYTSNRSQYLKTGGHSYEWGIYGHFLYNISNQIEPIILNSNVRIFSPYDDRLLYIIPSGEYNIQHSGDGGFNFTPMGWKIGSYIRFSNRINPLIPSINNFVEMGMLPGINGHQSLGADTDLGRFYLKIGFMVTIGINTKKISKH